MNGQLGYQEQKGVPKRTKAGLLKAFLVTQNMTTGGVLIFPCRQKSKQRT